MAGTSEGTAGAVQGSKDQVVKVSTNGMGWDILKLLDFETEIHSECEVNPVPVGSEILVTATPLLLGKCFQVWDIRFGTKKPKPPGSDSKIPELVLVALSRFSVMIIPTEDKFVPKWGACCTFGGATFMRS
ncbi:unnamed protein product [Calypogeia fissa]